MRQSISRRLILMRGDIYFAKISYNAIDCATCLQSLYIQQTFVVRYLTWLQCVIGFSRADKTEGNVLSHDTTADITDTIRIANIAIIYRECRVPSRNTAARGKNISRVFRVLSIERKFIR